MKMKMPLLSLMMKEVIVPASIRLQQQSSKRNLGAGLYLFVSKNFFFVNGKCSQSVDVYTWQKSELPKGCSGDGTKRKTSCP
jgi:hypothetical protein